MSQKLCKQLVYSCSLANGQDGPLLYSFTNVAPLELNRLGSYALSSDYVGRFRTAPDPLGSGMQMTMSMEAREQEPAHRDLLTGRGRNGLRTAFLDFSRAPVCGTAT